ncbi:triphosphoribosyl-dephospho-CoA synthase [Ancylobacter lacus]|uniref:triphosphoribosyl-dephospho-CoA synthase n=1 Tax=Ancylobacter lacus TaxID=2579970 RepID=UPI001BCD1FC9|nr:triphosphoribosyl-dephospho-CoA synthase [Ancylobacter lacus]MBS7539428.1 triphosphoribosyl-dephospho-CoA synthase [Ancylobacter lacus]
MDAAAIETRFLASCHEELDALKAGNVHRFSAGHGMEVAHFQAAAAAAAPRLCTPGARVGERIEAAVEASVAATGLNTNLGILLLCAPLAAAAERGGALRPALRAVLDGLSREDAAAAFRAITRANPGGLGRAAEHDVAAPPSITLREAMAVAAERDRIARQYAGGFDDIFEIGLPRLTAVPVDARAEAAHLRFMAAFPDSHILRKFGPEVAREVQAEAAQIEMTVPWHSPAEQRRAPLAAFDVALKRRGLNPGTSADLTVASLFAARLDGLISP